MLLLPDVVIDIHFNLLYPYAYVHVIPFDVVVQCTCGAVAPNLSRSTALSSLKKTCLLSTNFKQ